MIGIVHGYGLAGAGSNLWTRETVAALCDNGETVHLMCQESSPERFDFVAEVWEYPDGGEPERRLLRDVATPGRCVVHRPALNVLPTYVRPDRESDYVRSILDLDDAPIEEYLRRNLAALRRIVRDTGVRAWHVNHAILLSEALRRLRAEGADADAPGHEGAIAYAVMPHGSALEYVVRHDDRMKRVARRALEEADAVFALNQEIRDRLGDYFPELELAQKTATVRVGVDTDRFRPVPRAERTQAVRRLAGALEGVERGRGPEHAAALADALSVGLETDDDFRARHETAAAYTTARPDADLESKLETIEPERDRIVAFVGRLLPAKGVAALVVAFPRILERHPDARLLLVGAGWLREYLEAFVVALGRGDGELAYRLIEWAAARRQEGARPSALAFIRGLRERGEYENYVAGAAERLRQDRVLFTGYLEHPLLAHVFPLADVAVFPSAVAEASPLVVPEAAACGCLPMGTDFAGMHYSLASLAPRLPDHLAALMRLNPEPDRTAADIVANVNEALALDTDVTRPLRRAAVDEYDWHGIAETVARELDRL